MNTVYYRLPLNDVYTRISYDGEPLLLTSYADLGQREGFVIAPFVISDETPLILLPSDTPGWQRSEYRLSSATRDWKVVDEQEDRDAYEADFGIFHNQVNDGRFDKLVLSRCRRVTLDREPDQEQIFIYYCNAYPNAMVMLFSTPLSGTWLVASPEILLESDPSGALHTIALAGTMPYSEGTLQWSDKNRHEQHIVEQYIGNTIAPLCHAVTKTGPLTSRAGSLAHLRTDFTFTLDSQSSFGQVLSLLHPTPAVCGMPKERALPFVLANESGNRRYYTGFAGPIGMDCGTHLYVSLRCMSIDGNHCTVYAGGGIMPDSNADDEWNETRLKMIIAK